MNIKQLQEYAARTGAKLRDTKDRTTRPHTRCVVASIRNTGHWFKYEDDGTLTFMYSVNAATGSRTSGDKHGAMIERSILGIKNPHT